MTNCSSYECATYVFNLTTEEHILAIVDKNMIIKNDALRMLQDFISNNNICA